ncbi:TetR family transcriptional regulator [Actinokineospora guangxiensis]|uniref:TetR family transcriptional regulator n=1 Tax=Actinokineospora guangxiensis TaxID=1490288 RepID=A0ABW0ESB6_9PSEU
MAAVTEAAAGRVGPKVVAAAIELTASEGWSAVTMSRLAEAVGVSRQTVYNEVGSKPALAAAMIGAELARFLAAVEDAFDAHPDSPVDAVRGAVRGVLELAEDNVLLHAIVSASHGAETDLLPLLTTHAEALLNQAKAVVSARMDAHSVPMSERERAVVIDVLVRTVLSHVMQPSAGPADTADDIAWMIGRLLV